jgi:hypothetical protein
VTRIGRSLERQQKHHHRGQPLPAAPSALGCTPEPPELPGLAVERGTQAIHHQKRRSAWSRHESEWSKPVLREGARADPLTIGALPRCVLGRDRQKAPAVAADHGALVERPYDLRRLRVNQARSVELLVRVVPVAPAVGEPLAETGTRHLAAQLGLERATSPLHAGRHRELDLA